jgi:hypothetical protein
MRTHPDLHIALADLACSNKLMRGHELVGGGVNEEAGACFGVDELAGRTQRL